MHILGSLYFLLDIFAPQLVQSDYFGNLKVVNYSLNIHLVTLNHKEMF